VYFRQGFDDPDYEERAKEQMTIKPFKPKHLDVATNEEVCPVAKTPKGKEHFVCGGPAYSNRVGGCSSYIS
jgi:hypothetical protein